MTPLDALTLLDSLVSQALLTRADHERVIEAIQVLHSLLPKGDSQHDPAHSDSV